MAAYSSTPLARKLGIKAATTVVVVNGPANYQKLLGQAAHDVGFSDWIGSDSSLVHFFTTQRGELQKQLTRLRKNFPDTGRLWIS